MNLSELQRDALGEMANIGASRAAKQLSLLLDDHIDINVPRVELITLPELGRRLAEQGVNSIACVYQDLEGALNGQVFLVFHDQDSRSLVHALIGDAEVSSQILLREYEHEAITEVGNIIISTFAAMMADLLVTDLRLGLPHYSEGEADILLAALPSDVHPETTVVIVVQTVLTAANRNVSGALMVVLKVHSAEALLERLDAMIRNLQGNA
ncbi:MAG: chemotaxis protein CheC [Chromatiales bacterium]|jgi:chemotaxis protein CheC|nr:chemotaxis protein CheC [Chromatiales bacterium]MDX9766113.1 chemotaxis protein CheC [Ectothiorhodospiraceae bacterium]